MTMFGLAEGSIQLVPDGTLLVHMALIIIMVVVVNKTLLGPINRVLAERESRTKGRFGEAEAAVASASKRMAEYERRVREARASGYKDLEDMRAAAAVETSSKINEVKSEVGAWRDAEKAKVAAAQEEVKTNLAGDARARAAEISSRILGRSVGS
ncbi:MAG TPA: ATP synthase F0 subunit B [Pyrinomonadaceae bacterium]|nr:ATP synthase F0 subunit B [Pyrinomonadaceae bacterium]